MQLSFLTVGLYLRSAYCSSSSGMRIELADDVKITSDSVATLDCNMNGKIVLGGFDSLGGVVKWF